MGYRNPGAAHPEISQKQHLSKVSFSQGWSWKWSASLPTSTTQHQLHCCPTVLARSPLGYYPSFYYKQHRQGGVQHTARTRGGTQESVPSEPGPNPVSAVPDDRLIFRNFLYIGHQVFTAERQRSLCETWQPLSNAEVGRRW